MMCEEQGGLRREKGYVDQVFVVRQLCEKVFGNKQGCVMGIH